MPSIFLSLNYHVVFSTKDRAPPIGPSDSMNTSEEPSKDSAVSLYKSAGSRIMCIC